MLWLGPQFVLGSPCLSLYPAPPQSSLDRKRVFWDVPQGPWVQGRRSYGSHCWLQVNWARGQGDDISTYIHGLSLCNLQNSPCIPESHLSNKGIESFFLICFHRLRDIIQWLSDCLVETRFWAQSPASKRQGTAGGGFASPTFPGTHRSRESKERGPQSTRCLW